jgi:hypothetical protein
VVGNQQAVVRPLASLKYTNFYEELKMKANVFTDEQMHALLQTSKLKSRKISLAGGVLYLTTFILVPSFMLYAPLRDPNYMISPGPDGGVIFGGALEIIVALAGIGTAVVLYPVLKRQNDTLALGFIGSRIVEACTIFAGVVSLLTMVSLRQSGAGAEGLITGRALINMYDWFHLGQTIMPAVNDALLGYLLYKSRLVPRILPVLGLVGAPFLFANAIALMFGITGPVLTLTTLSVIPIALFEFALGVYLAVKGFKSTKLIAEFEKAEANRPE